MNRIKGALASLASLVLLFALSATSYGQANFTARLTGQQEAPYPGVATSATGTGTFLLSPGGLQFFLTVEGLSGPIMAADFQDAPPGLPGPVVRDILPEFSGSHTAAGFWSAGDSQPLTSTLVNELLDGNVCVNIHTAANPAGEIRGQVQLSSGVHFTANLQPTQVNPPSGATGTGAGSFTLADRTLHYKITVTGLGVPITGASLRFSAIGVNGGIAYPIGATFVGTTAEGSVNISPVDRQALLAGNMYVNIETGPFPAGQIRGQINLAGGFGFSIKLEGAQETPPNASPGLGTASATLTSAGLRLDLSASGLTGAITGAHLHNAPAGAPGAIVRDIMADFVSPTTAVTLWRSDDAMPLTPSLLKELLNNNIYVDLHTAAFPGGEIRGQLILNTPSPVPTATYTATLAGPQEEPPTGAPGLGTGTFQLTPGGLTFRVTVNGLTGAITAAHFHSGAIGVGGPVVRPMAAAELIGPNTFAGTWAPTDASPFTPALMTELFKGNLYFNVHTAANPGGEIRGQILPASGAEFEARLTSAQETPPNGTTGLGTGSFTLTPFGLAFNITSDGLTGAITAAHFHSGQRGVGAAIVRGFTAGEFVTPTTLAGVWQPTDAQALTPTLIQFLLKGNLYVNMHTAANPGGEIRGQLTLSGGIPEGARPVGSQETPPVVTPGKATAAMTLTDEGHVFRYSANDMTGLPTAEHFHDAPVGVPGPIVRPIYAAEMLGTESGDGVWMTSDADPLTTGLLGEMMIENLYFNLHTAANPGGEIRGQIGSPLSTVGVGETAIRGAVLQLSSTPNPAANRATVSFFLPRRSTVDLRVFDVRGAEVARLVRGTRDGGWQHVSFDTARLSNGVYFVDLAAGGARANRKLLVIR